LVEGGLKSNLHITADFRNALFTLESTSALVATLEVTRADLLLVSAEEIQRRPNPPLWPLLGAALIGMVLGIGMTMLWG